MDNVTLTKTENISSVLDSVALAYENYPLFNYLICENSKATPIKQILASSIKSSKTEFICISLGEESKATAIFVKPIYKGSPTIPFLLAGGLKLILKYSPSIILRLLNYEKYAMKMKSKYSDNNCWYLYSLTVHPDYQHKGLATKVITPMLNFFDATGQSCYIETNDSQNVPLYEHFGFKLMETGNIPKTKVVHYSMRREAKLK